MCWVPRTLRQFLCGAAASSILHLLQNNDRFGQVGEQTRYMFFNALGLKANIEPLVRKIDVPELLPKNFYETVYAIEQLKLCTCIQEARLAKTNLALLKGALSNRLELMMPCDLLPTSSFEYQTDMCYLYQVTNREKSDMVIP